METVTGQTQLAHGDKERKTHVMGQHRQSLQSVFVCSSHCHVEKQI